MVPNDSPWGQTLKRSIYARRMDPALNANVSPAACQPVERVADPPLLRSL